MTIADALPQVSPRLVLASQSPRRRELLAEAGWVFDVLLPDPRAEQEAEAARGADCAPDPAELVAHLARAKAADVVPRAGDAVVLACDTVAECDGEILGKPLDRDDARRMLTRLGGTVHRVYSGLCLWRTTDGRCRVAVDVTELRMTPLSPSQLASYLDSGLWQGKAGAFGYQDELDWVRIVRGSASNVIGLPLELLARMLAEFTAESPPDRSCP